MTAPTPPHPHNHTPIQVVRCIKGSISSKQPGWEDLLASLIADACIQVCPKNAGNFNVDNVRTVKIVGSGLAASSVVNGMVLKRDAEGTIKSLENVKVAVFAQGVDTETTEGKVCVLVVMVVYLFVVVMVYVVYCS